MTRWTRRLLPALALPLFVAAIASTACDIVTADLRAEQSTQWQKTFPIDANGRVDIGNVNGKIEVEPSTRNTVEVVAIKKAHGVSTESAKAALDRISIAEDVSPSRVKIETKMPSGGGIFGNNGQVEYHVKVPPGVEARFTTINGGVEVHGLTGRVTAATTNGGVTARDVSGELDASTTNGGLDIDLARMPEGGVKLGCTNGGISVSLPRDAKATISASIVNGHIDAGDLPIDQSEHSRRRLEGRMNGGGPRLEMGGVNGGINLKSR